MRAAGRQPALGWYWELCACTSGAHARPRPLAMKALEAARILRKQTPPLCSASRTTVWRGGQTGGGMSRVRGARERKLCVSSFGFWLAERAEYAV